MVENVFVPAAIAAGAGGVALVSLVLSATVSVELTGFQLASTALTVTLKLAAAVSPGIRSWSLVKAPALIVVAGLVLAVMPALVMSVAVKVFEPAVFGVTEEVLVPATSTALAGRAALASLGG